MVEEIESNVCNKEKAVIRNTESLKQNTSNIQKRVEMQDLMQWEHLDPTNSSENNISLMEDPILKGALRYLSYVFKNEVHASTC